MNTTARKRSVFTVRRGSSISTNSPSRVYRRLPAIIFLAATLSLADALPPLPEKCRCWRETNIAYRCSGCTSLPQDLPQGIVSVNMTANDLTHIRLLSTASFNWGAVKKLYLGKNRIRTVRREDLAPFKSLMTLDLSSNNLVLIEEDSIAANPQLKRLVLDDNPQLQLVALHSESLTELFLENCGLTIIDQHLFKHLKGLLSLYLAGNDRLDSAKIKQVLRLYWPDLHVSFAFTKYTNSTTIRKEATSSAVDSVQKYEPHLNVTHKFTKNNRTTSNVTTATSGIVDDTLIYISIICMLSSIIIVLAIFRAIHNKLRRKDLPENKSQEHVH